MGLLFVKDVRLLLISILSLSLLFLLIPDNSFGAGYYGTHHGNNFGYHRGGHHGNNSVHHGGGHYGNSHGHQGGHRGYNRNLHQQWNREGYERHNGNFGYGHNNYRDNGYDSRQPITIVINNQGACYGNGVRRSGHIENSEGVNFEVEYSEPYVFKYNEEYKPGANAFVFNAKGTGSDGGLSSNHGDVYVYGVDKPGTETHVLESPEEVVPVLNSSSLLVDNN